MSNYIVWNPSSRLPPTVIHPDRATAIRVAGRMAAKEPGEKFYVCKLVHLASMAPRPAVEFLDLEKADEEVAEGGRSGAW
jgi:hypothetical protein